MYSALSHHEQTLNLLVSMQNGGRRCQGIPPPLVLGANSTDAAALQGSLGCSIWSEVELWFAGLLAAKLGWMQLGPAPSLQFFLLRLMPVVACAAGSLYLGNLAYLSLSVAFIQILKVGRLLVCLPHEGNILARCVRQGM